MEYFSRRGNRFQKERGYFSKKSRHYLPQDREAGNPPARYSSDFRQILFSLSSISEVLSGIACNQGLLPDYGLVYEKATRRLVEHIRQSTVSDQIRVAAYNELALLTQSIELVLSGQISLVTPGRTDGNTLFSGYHTVDDGKKRVTIFHKDAGINEARKHRSSCRFGVHDVKDISSRGKVIGGDDSLVEATFGYTLPPSEGPFWTISFASGAKDLTKTRWLSVYPLSQVIYEHKNSFPTSNIEDNYDYHYPLRIPVAPNPVGDFITFNQALKQRLSGFTR